MDDLELRHDLLAAIDGKGAFRRFKDALMGHPVDRERWFTFRSERLRACMEAWLTTHGITAAERPAWRVPEAVPGTEDAGQTASATLAGGAPPAVMTSVLAALTSSETEMVHAFAAFLISRRSRSAPTVEPSED